MKAGGESEALQARIITGAPGGDQGTPRHWKTVRELGVDDRVLSITAELETLCIEYADADAYIYIRTFVHVSG